MAERVRHVIGCMTGTSLDGLDAALVRITGTGLEMKAEFVGMVSHPLGELADALRSMANGDAHPPIDFLRAARKLGELHAAACATLVEDATSRGAKRVDFVVAHGQTIWHAPRDAQGHLSWQLFDPWPIVRRLGVPVCYDLRQADLIAGGEGAPVTPIADWVMYRSERNARTIVNLGGICNVTELFLDGAPEHLRGWDVGPCNLLLDGLVRRLIPGKSFDEGGKLAASGHVNVDLMNGMIGAILTWDRGTVSKGREQFGNAFLGQVIEISKGAKPESVLATASDVLGKMIAGAAGGTDPDTQIVVAGGGSRNLHLVEQIRRSLTGRRSLIRTDELGIPVDAREAMAFAVLGALSQDGVAITLPKVTGRDSGGPVRAGAWVYP